MVKQKARPLKVHTRAIMQSAKFAIRDIYDAIIELVTNSDDRYQILKRPGIIEIELERRRGESPSILRVRDYADGMDARTMKSKLSSLGGRVSGLAEGEDVRGTHSRGAKDVAALGRVVFESIACNGLFHKCEITPFLEFLEHESQKVTQRLRKKIGIPQGTGTVVTIHLDKTQSVPLHDTLKRHISHLVSLRGIICDGDRKVVLRDLGQNREDEIRAPNIVGADRLKTSFEIPSYSGARAKLIIKRAKQRFEKEPPRFRLGGILVMSKHAIHESTLFDNALESDPHAQWFFGKLTCPYIDDLCNEFDDLFEEKKQSTSLNPMPPLDPSRRSGLTRDHPFVKALFTEALKRLRPLVEEERTREEHERANIESYATRKRLDALQKAAVEFIKDFGEDDEPSRDPDGQNPESRFRERGYALSPPFTQIIAGHSQRFWLSIHQEIFPEIEVKSTVQVECLSPDIMTDTRFCILEPHPNRENVLRAIWKVKALKANTATGIRARVGTITTESIIEVLNNEAEKYQHVDSLSFSRKRYKMRTDQKRKKLRIFAPLHMVPKPVQLNVTSGSNHFEITGEHILKPTNELGIAVCDTVVRSDGTEATAVLTAKLNGHEATAIITSIHPMGADLSIKLEDIDLGNQRYRWRQNVLEVAARHPSLRRYLGDKQHNFPGQESKHFRLLLAEVVSDAVCALLVRRNEQANPEEFEDADWDQFYAIYSKYMTQFLPIAHELQCPDA